MNFFKSMLLKKMGYQKIESRHKISNAFEAQQHLVTDPKTIFDVGAHVGDVSKKFRKYFPHATIHAFEPFLESFEKLKMLFQSDSHVQLHPIALFDETRSQILFTNKESATNSLLPNSSQGALWSPAGVMEPLGAVEVNTMTLSKFCNDFSIHSIDILKLDTQGAELRILNGAIDLLKSKSISLIYTEILFVPLYEGQAYFHELCSFLCTYNYRLFDIFNIRYAENGQAKWGDVIFIHDKMSSIA